jgi:hypothetical protein
MSVRIPVLAAMLACAVAPSGFPAEAAAPFVPETHGIDRYAMIWKRSPFIVETVAVQVSVGLAGRFSLVGIVTVGGKPKAFLVDNTISDPVKNRLLVSVGEASKGSGVELVSVNMDPDPRKSSAVIKLGAQQATLPFNTASLAPQGPNPQGSGAVPPPSTGIRNPMPLVPPPAVAPGSSPSTNANLSIPAPPAPSRRIIRPPVNLSN